MDADRTFSNIEISVQYKNLISSSNYCFSMECPREYELMTKAHAKLTVVRNCSRSSFSVCLGEGKQLMGSGWSAVAGGGGRQTVHRETESGTV